MRRAKKEQILVEPNIAQSKNVNQPFGTCSVILSKIFSFLDFSLLSSALSKIVFRGIRLR